MGHRLESAAGMGGAHQPLAIMKVYDAPRAYPRVTRTTNSLRRKNGIVKGGSYNSVYGSSAARQGEYARAVSSARFFWASAASVPRPANGSAATVSPGRP